MAIPIGAASYAAAAAAFLLLFLLLMTSWRGRLQGMLLAAASLATAAWAGVLAYTAAAPNVAVGLAEVLEVLRSVVWFAFLMVLLGYSRNAIRPLRLTAASLAVFCGLAIAATLYASVTAADRAGMFAVLLGLVLALVGMVLVEQVFRNVHPQQRWGIILLCLGLGGMFVCDFYLYSDALLFRRIDADIWAARGAIDAMIVPLLAVAAARNPKWSLNIAVSRRILFHSTAVAGAAVYLLAMAAAGYYIRFAGGSWGVALQFTFVFGALLLLFVILVSGTLRARLKVFLSKNFFSYRYDYREEWLRFTRTLSEGEPGVQLRERSIKAIAELVDSPSGALWLSQDSGAFEQAAQWNMPAIPGVVQPGSALCQFLETREWVINLEEYAAHPGLYNGLELPDFMRLIPRAWLVVPLMLHERLLGFVVLVSSKGRIGLNWEVNDILKTAGRQAANYLAQLEAAKALLVARQFESFNRMSAFVVHDLKNLVAQLSLLLSNAERHKHKPAFQDDMIGTVTNSVEKMNRLLVQLRGGYALEPPVPIALDDLLQHAVTAKSDRSPVPRLKLADGAVSVVGHPARLERVIGHLIQNAIEATPVEGGVSLRLVRKNGSAVITIADTGCGMSEQFMRNRLFRPFESTKTTGMGIGTYEARQYVHEIGGRIEVESEQPRGTTFRVVLPLYVAADATETSAAAGGRM